MGNRFATRFIYENSKIMTNFCFWPNSATSIYESEVCACVCVCVSVYGILCMVYCIIFHFGDRRQNNPEHLSLTAEITAIARVLRERGTFFINSPLEKCAVRGEGALG